MGNPLTEPQRLMLAALQEANDQCARIPGCGDGEHSPNCPQGGGRPRSASPRQLALMRWPDSPAWQKRTRKYGTNDPGAMGGTMPMKAATVLWRLHGRGLATRVGASYDRLANLWEITERGRRVLAGEEEA